MSRLTTLSLAAGLLLGCSPQPPVSPPPQNVILLLVDTLRADHLGTYGYSRSTSPGLDRLAENMVVFENALSQAACTFPSVNSIFTSRYPASFRPSSPGDWSIPASLATLPEILLERGYSTLAISASPVVRRTPSHHNTTGGYDRGFSVFDETCLGKDASCIGQRARHLLTEPDAPVFLYLHYMEPHNPYQPPPIIGAASPPPRGQRRSFDVGIWGRSAECSISAATRSM